MASMLVFGPQSKPPQEQYLKDLRAFLCNDEKFNPFVQGIMGLEKTWSLFADQRADIRAMEQGPRYMRAISQWLIDGKSSDIVKPMTGIIGLPLLVIAHIGQYFQYLDRLKITHAELLSRLGKGGGIQGYCGGLPSALAIACSRNEEEVMKNAATAIRIALGIGAYAELGDDESVPGATTIVIRTKWEGQGEELVNKFHGVRS